MSITDELRERVKRSMALPPQETESILAIADRIDAEHEAKVAYWQDASYKDGYDEGFASADDYFTDKRETLKEHGWVKLPVDADGVPIRVGDEMDSKVDYLFDGRPFEVRALVLCEGGWEAADGRFGNRYEPNSLRHHRPHTVEDVLRDFAYELSKRQNAPEMFDPSELYAEYAAKLRLAEREDS